MHKWLSFAFIGEYDENFNPKLCEEYNKLIEFFHNGKAIDTNSENYCQVVKDCDRTFQDQEYYHKGQKGYRHLKEILIQFIAHEKAQECGYVQGMNYIAATLLYHAQVDIVFCLFIKIMDQYDLVNNYKPGCPGLTKHCETIDKMVFKHLRTLHNFLVEQAMPTQMYSIELIFGLFGSKIPITDMHLFYDKFFELGWSFFYSLVIVYLTQFDFLESESSSTDKARSMVPHPKSLKWKHLIVRAIDFEISNR